MNQITEQLSPEQLAVLINIKLDFYRDEDVRDNFIDTILVNHPSFAVAVYNAMTNKTPMLKWEGKTYYIQPNQWTEIETFAKTNRKVDCIKAVRTATGMGLKEAKDYVEATWPDSFRYSTG